MTRTIPLFTCVLLLIALTACNPTATAPAATAVPAVTATAPAVPTAGSTATAVSTATVPPTAAVSPTAAAADTAAPSAPGDVISAENAAGLTPTSVTLPDWPGGFFWPGAGVQVPGAPEAADLYARLETNSLVPIQLDPPSAGAPVQVKIPGNTVFFSPDLSGAAAMTMGDKAQLTQFDLNGKPVRTYDVPDPYGASYSPDGSLLAVTTANEMSIVIYDVKTGQRVTKLTGFQTAAPVYSAGILPDNKTAYWLSRATLQLQEIGSGEMGQAVSFEDFIGQVQPSSDGSRLTIAVAGKLIVYKVPYLEKVAEINVSQPINALALSPDGKLLAAGYGSGIQIWDAASLAPVASLPGPNDFTGLVSFSPDGKYLVSLHTGNVVNIWKVK